MLCQALEKGCAIASRHLGLFAWIFDLKYIPLGVAYAIWSGLGTVGRVLFGLLIWNEILGPVHIFAIALIVGDVVVLNVVPSY